MSGNNGSNPRLDRIERILDGLTKSHAESDARHERWMAQQERRWAESDARFERWSTRFRSDLKRWAALGVKEARNQRKRYQKLDEYMTRLAAAQLVTEEKLKNLLSSRGNGQHGKSA
jgi:hypothetical protein